MLAEAQTEVSSLVSKAIELIAEDKTINLDKKMIDGTISKIKKESSNG